MLGYLDYTKSVLHLIQGKDSDVLEWAVNSIATYREILKMVKHAGQGNKTADLL